MFYILRAYQFSWILLLVPALAALYSFLYQNTDIFPKGDDDADQWFDNAITIVVAAATATLSFILSMTLSGAMTKNSEGIAMFNAFTGDLRIWYASLGSIHDEKKKTSSMSRRARIFAIFFLLGRAF